MLVQLDFFETDETSVIKQEIINAHASIGRIRRALFARNGELSKQVLDLTQRLEIIEQGLCNAK
jgi:hypothetical protein